MSTSQKITNTLNVQAAKAFVQSVQENAAYYVFAAKHTPFLSGSDDNPPSPEDTTLSAIAAYDDMLFGKRVKTEQITNMIKRYVCIVIAMAILLRKNSTLLWMTT